MHSKLLLQACNSVGLIPCRLSSEVLYCGRKIIIFMYSQLYSLVAGTLLLYWSRIDRQQNFPFPRQSFDLHSDINEYTSKVELYLTTEKVLPAVSKQAGCFENACSKWWSHVYLSNLSLPFLPILVIILSSRLTLQTFTLCLSALPIVELPNVSPSHDLDVSGLGLPRQKSLCVQ